jgi:hypothetical protein
MRTLIFAMTTVAGLVSLPAVAGTVQADTIWLAQIDVQIGPPAVRVEEERRPGVVIEERRRPGVVIEGTDGRTRDCVTRSQSETRNGVTVTEKERECAR